MEEDLKPFYGVLDPVEYKSGHVYVLCNQKGCLERSPQLSRHIQKQQHGYDPRKAGYIQSLKVRMFNYLCKVDKSKDSKPSVCLHCDIMVD